VNRGRSFLPEALERVVGANWKSGSYWEIPVGGPGEGGIGNGKEVLEKAGNTPTCYLNRSHSS
jgi:hypothetical protein